MYISKNKNMLGIYIIIFGFVFFFRGVRKLPRNGLKALPGALFLNNFPWKILERLFLFFFSKPYWEHILWFFFLGNLLQILLLGTPNICFFGKGLQVNTWAAAGIAKQRKLKNKEDDKTGKRTRRKERRVMRYIYLYLYLYLHNQ